MQRVGRVLHISSTKNVILEAENVPRIGDRVVDADLQPIGRVFDIFGPISSPYISVKTNLEDSRCLIGNVLYNYPSSKHSRKRRRKKK